MERLKELLENEIRKKGKNYKKLLKNSKKCKRFMMKMGIVRIMMMGIMINKILENGKNNLTKKKIFSLIKKGIISFAEILISPWYIIIIPLLLLF